jgi:hypothetical protein
MVPVNFVLLIAEHSKMLVINGKGLFHKRDNCTGRSNVKPTILFGKRVTLFQLKICVLLKVVNITQFKTQAQNASLA